MGEQTRSVATWAEECAVEQICHSRKSRNPRSVDVESKGPLDLPEQGKVDSLDQLGAGEWMSSRFARKGKVSPLDLPGQGKVVGPLNMQGQGKADPLELQRQAKWVPYIFRDRG